MKILGLTGALLLFTHTALTHPLQERQDPRPHSTELFTCPSGWTYFCFSAASTSSCECYRMTPPTSKCPTGTTKYCSDYITTECSCSYPKQPDCPPMFDFECVPATGREREKATWVCTCSGRVYGESACPIGFTSRCSPTGGLEGSGERGCSCRKVRTFLSEYTPRPGEGGKVGELEVGWGEAPEVGWVGGGGGFELK